MNNVFVSFHSTNISTEVTHTNPPHALRACQNVKTQQTLVQVWCFFVSSVVLRHRTTPAARMLPLPSAFSTTNIPTTVGIFRATRVIVGQGTTFLSLTGQRGYVSTFWYLFDDFHHVL